MKRTIEIKTSTYKNLWCKFVNDNRFQPGTKELCIDFSTCTFVEPFQVVLLACLIEEYHQHNAAIRFEIGDNLVLNEYLASIRFFHYWNTGFDRSEFYQQEKGTNLNLWKLHPERLNSYVDFSKQFYERNFPLDKSFEPIYISLSELFNNIIDHSQSEILGFTTCQFYPKQGKLKIAVCDFGRGIPATINSYFQRQGLPALPSPVALARSFELRFSTKSTPQNRGFGLDTLLSIVKRHQGQLRVISNDAMLLLEGAGPKTFSIKHNFRGTHFEVILDVNTFETKNEEVFDEDFSF